MITGHAADSSRRTERLVVRRCVLLLSRLLFQIGRLSLLGPLFLWALDGVAGEPPVYAAAVRQSPNSWLLEDGGSALFRQVGFDPPYRAIIPHGVPPASPWNRRPPTSFARWKDRWLFVNGTGRLFVFDAAGGFLDDMPTADAALDVIVAGETVWTYSPVQRDPVRVWHSADGHRFSPRVLPFTPDPAPLLRAVESALLMAGGPDGSLYLTQACGPPEMKRLESSGDVSSFPLAYSRSHMRAMLERPTSDGPEQLTDLSSPVLDLVALQDGGLLVLRNREDVLVAESRIESVKGRRVDRYDSQGRQTATAVFPEQMRWILRIDESRVIALATSGKVLTATLGRPAPGGVLP